MTVKELRAFLDRINVGEDTEITVFGVGHGLPLELTGDWSRGRGETGPVLLHSRVNDKELGA